MTWAIRGHGAPKEVPGGTSSRHPFPKALIESQLRFADVVNSAMDAIVTLDSVQRIVLFNPAAQQMFGYRAEEVLGQPINLLLPERYQTAHTEHVREFARTEQTVRRMGQLGSVSAMRANGEEFPIEASISQVTIDDERFFTVIIRDISERRKAEAALKRSEELNRVLCSLTSDFAFCRRLAPDGSVSMEWVSDPVTNVLGYTAEELSGNEKWLSIIHPDDRALAAEQHERQLAGEEVAPCELRVVTKAGHVRWVRMYAKPVWDETRSRVVQIIGAAQDVTARREAEAALIASENHLRAILRSEPECVKLLSEDGTLLEINPAGLMIIEADYPEQVIGQNVLSLVLAGHRAAFDQLIRRVFKGESGRMEFEMCGLKGTRRWMQMHVTPLREHGGQITAALSVTHDITDRKRNEAARAALEKRNEFFVRALGEIVYEHDVIGDRLQWAGDTVNCIGWTIEELGTSTAGWLDRVHPDDLPRVLAAFRKPKQEIFAVEYRFRHKAGHYNWVFDRGVMARNAEDRVVHLTGIMWDITARKRAEEALQESDERFRLLAEHINEVFWIADLGKNRIVYASPAYEKIWGRSCAELCAGRESWFDAVHPDDRERVIEAAAARQTQGTYDEEFRIVRPDGTVRWIHDCALPVRNREGIVDRLVGVARDVTGAKEAAAELQRREERFRLLTENASDLITVINGEGMVRYQSPSAERISGYTADELIGRKAFEFIHPDDVGRVVAALSRTLAEPGTPVSVEYRFQHRDGRWLLLQSIGQSIPGEAEDGFIVVNSRDATEQRHLEDQVRQAQKMEAIGQLAGGVAHDFNNMLSVISVHSELLAMTFPPGDPLHESVNDIHQAAERAAALTRQLLAFSRRQIIEPKILDLNSVISDTERMLGRLIGEDVRLSTALAADLQPVRVDASQIDQVLMNLAVNARDAMPQGGNLTIETHNIELDEAYAATHPEVTPGKYVLVAVSDTGCGMTPEVLGRAFEPFFTTKGPGRGTGLGLAVVHGIVKQSGGHVSVYSEPGVGTTFKLYLPAVPEPAFRTGEPQAPLPRGTETVLLVEDEDAVRRTTALALESLGYSVLQARNGEETLELIESTSTPVHLLLTDVVMPGISGRELADALRSTHPQLRVIFQSGYTDDAVVRHGILAADVAFMQKPVRISSLARKVREVLDVPHALPRA